MKFHEVLCNSMNTGVPELLFGKKVELMRLNQLKLGRRVKGVGLPAESLWVQRARAVGGRQLP